MLLGLGNHFVWHGKCYVWKETLTGENITWLHCKSKPSDKGKLQWAHAKQNIY